MLVESSQFGVVMSENCAWTKQLAAAGAPLDQKDICGSTSLHLAARRGDLDMVVLLLQCGMDINIRGANGW